MVSRQLRGAITFVRNQRYVGLWEQYYWVGVGFLIIAGVLLMGRPFLDRHGLGPPLPHNDSVILEYVGWFLAQGNTLYVDIWEIKPPLAFLPPYVYALFTGSNMYLHHLLGIATTSLALAITGALAARIVGTITDSPHAGLATGICFFALPDLFYLPWLGYKAKIMVFVFGLAALDRALHERFLASGFLAGLAVGFWQLAVVFPLLTLVAARLSDSTDATRNFLKGTAIAGIVIFGTVLLYADLGGFLAEVVLGPLVLKTGQEPFRLSGYFRMFPESIGPIITIVGVVGLASVIIDYRRSRAAPLALGGLLTACVLFIDFDGVWDAVLPLVFTALGVGLFLGYFSRRTGLVTIVLVSIVLSTTFAPTPLIRQAPMDMRESTGYPPALDPARESVYWNAQKIKSCRFFGSGTQRSLLQYYPNADRLVEAPCGNLRLYASVLIDRLVPGSTDPSSYAGVGDGRQSKRTPTKTLPPPTQTPTSTPSQVVIGEGFGYHTDNETTVVRVPFENRGTVAKSVVIETRVTIGGQTLERCKQVNISAGAEQLLRFRFDAAGEDPSIRVNIKDRC